MYVLCLTYFSGRSRSVWTCGWRLWIWRTCTACRTRLRTSSSAPCRTTSQSESSSNSSTSMSPHKKYRLQTTIDFLIHLSYKTGHFGGLYKIPWSSNSKINHFIWMIMINSACKKNMNIGSSLNFWELGPFLRGTLSSATCRTIGTIKTYFILSLNDNIISHQE